VEVQLPSFSTTTPDGEKIISLSELPTAGHGLRMLGGAPSPLLATEKRKILVPGIAKGDNLWGKFRGLALHYAMRLMILYRRLEWKA
jgi:hypothetical protein